MKKLPFYLLCVTMLAASSVVSCVKNNESASVTNLRNAKTEQLQSIAAMNLATAKATEIQAVADVKLTEAQATYQNALAAVQNASAAEKQIAVDKAKATLAKDIELLLVTANASIETQKLLFTKALDAYNAYMAANPNPFLDVLVATYKTQMTSLYTAITAVNTAKANILGLQAGVINAQQWLATQTAIQNEAIIAAQALLDAYKAIPANDRPAAYKAWQEALAKVDNIKAGMKKVVDPVNAVNDAVAAKIAQAKNNDYYTAVDAPVAAANSLKYTFTNYAGTVSAEQSSSILIGGIAVATQNSPILMMNKIEVTAGNIPTYTEVAANKTYHTVAVNLVLLNQQIQKLTGDVKNAKTAYDKAVTDAEAVNTKDLAALEADVVAKQKAYDEALAKGVPADIATAKTALDTAMGLVTAFKSSVSPAFDAWAKVSAELAAWNAWGLQLSATNKAAYDAAIKAITDEFAKYEAAHKAYADVATQVAAQIAIAGGLERLYNGLVDKDALVAQATNDLNEAKATLAELVGSVNAPDAKEAALAIAKKKVTDAELAVTVIQKTVDTLKAQIDAELKK